MTMNMETILIRYDSQLLYGSRDRMIEYWADICGLTLSDIHSITMMLADAEIGNPIDFDDEALITELFMGQKDGRKILKVIRKNMGEILSIVPEGVTELRYLRTLKGAVYAIGLRPTDILDGLADVLP